MPKARSWSDGDLVAAVETSKSYRRVLVLLRLIPAGGNYEQIKRRIRELQLSAEHFTGSRWNVGRTYVLPSTKPVTELLISNSDIQSYKLKAKLFAAGIKSPACELCGWAEKSGDGRIPVELDHVNGDHRDNRLENLRVLCPNCHSLQPTHRGKNKKVYLARVV